MSLHTAKGKQPKIKKEEEKFSKKAILL